VNLVVGATGMLGSEICRLLAESGRPVRGLVRSTSDAGKVERLRSLGVDVVEGDLADQQSLERACAGAATVLSTATAIGTGESLEETDDRGNGRLIEAARETDVGHFLFVSFVELPVRFPLQDAKRSVERRLQGALPYTILRPTLFMEFWLGPIAGWDIANGRVTVLGSGDRALNWISLVDVARMAVAAMSDPRAHDTVLEFGADYASANEALALAEEAAGEQFRVEHVPIEQLQAEKEAVEDPHGESFAGIRLSAALGYPEDHTATLREFVPDPVTLRAFMLERATRGS
jgi:uncharacterized protein YbjT (DUF2867 family)